MVSRVPCWAQTLQPLGSELPSRQFDQENGLRVSADAAAGEHAALDEPEYNDQCHDALLPGPGCTLPKQALKLP